MKNIKKLIIFLAIFVSFLLFFVLSSIAAEKAFPRTERETFSERITFYNTKIAINEDATLNIQETIKYDFGIERRHGIFRDIPTTYISKKGIHKIKIYDISVKDEKGNPYKFEVSHLGGNIHIKIGNKDKLISGKKTYIISYKVKRGLKYFEDHNELYWNAIGFGWELTIDAAEAEVFLPQNSFVIKAKCFTGLKGEKRECQNKKVSKNYVKFSQTKLGWQRGMTVVVSLPKGSIFEPSLFLKTLYWINDNLPFELILFVFLAMFSLWLKKGRDEKGKGTIIPRFEIPQGLIPLEVNTVLKEKFLPKDISAEIIHLAIKGYLKIKRTEKKFWLFKLHDYELIKLDKDRSSLKSSQKKILNFLFREGSRVSLNKISQRSNFNEIKEIKEKTRQTVVKEDILKEESEKIKKVGTFIAVVLIMVGPFFLVFLNIIWAASFVLGGIIILIFSNLMPKKTKKGSLLKEEILGLKRYLEVAEKARLEFHNAPEKNPQTFEKYLPYAIALGVEKKWAKQFKDIYKEPPEWYVGARGQFNAVLFTSSLNSFSRSLSSAFHISGGGAGSGFGGGGSAGGGFGGDGGGSW